MFLDTSRYAKVLAETVVTADGREVTAIRLRPLPPVKGVPRLMMQGDRLDVIADRAYGDGTRAWHIADANTALEAGDLVAEVLAVFDMPVT